MTPQLITIILAALGGAAAATLLVAAFFSVRRTNNQPAPSTETDSEQPEEPPDVAADTRANQLLATMSHEIRTPLNGVLGMLQLLHDTNMSREQRRIVRTVLDSGQVLSQVLDDHLAYFRLESGLEITASPGVCELEDVVHQTMMLFQGLAYEKGLEFVLIGDPRAPYVVRTDTQRLRQVLSNLILNAIKYTDSGEVTVSIEQVAETTEISVSDTGPGMSDEVLANLFSPYFRAEANAASEKGSGLGLVIARRLVEVMGGELAVESVPGMGTTFTLRFEFETLLASAPEPPDYPWEKTVIVGGSPSAATALADVLEGLGLQAKMVDTSAGARTADLVFDFSTGSGSRSGPAAPGSVGDSDAVLVDVLCLSDPRTHRREEVGHVLVEPFSRATVGHLLSELASGARRTSTVNRWRNSMAESYPLSILVAEDDDVSSKVIAGMLTNLGYAPTIVGSGPEAVAVLNQRRFDIALLDLNLPGFGGIEILGRADQRDTWWIAMSASVQPELRKRCRDAGFRDFLPKPLAAGALQSALVRGAGRDSGIVGQPDSESTRRTQLTMSTGSNGIDHMRELFAQSPGAYRDLLEAHIDQTDLLCADLEQSLSGRGDPETARRATHTLQAAAASFGCAKVAAHARTIEAEWDALTPERRHLLTRRLIDAWRDEERAEIVRELESLSA